MSLNLRSVALQGLGAGLLAFALQGLVPEQRIAQDLHGGGGKTKTARELDIEGLEDRVRAHWERIEALRAAQSVPPQPSTVPDSPAVVPLSAQSVPLSSVSSVPPGPVAKTVADAYALGARTEEEAALLLAVLQLEVSITQPAARDPDEDLAIALLLAAEAAQHPPSMAA